MTTFVEKVLAVADTLTAAGIPFAFGGALALAYCVGDPRATADIDVNVFVGPAAAGQVFAALPDGVVADCDDASVVEREGQVRVWWGETALDLFFSYHAVHVDAARRARTVPFGDGQIPVLACDHLALFKVLFDRTRDWADLEAMVAGGAVDRSTVEGLLAPVVGVDDPRIERFRTLAERAPQPEPDPRGILGRPGSDG